MSKAEYVEELKRIIREDCQSIAAVTSVEKWLKKSNEEDFIDPVSLRLNVEELNKEKEGRDDPTAEATTNYRCSSSSSSVWKWRSC